MTLPSPGDRPLADCLDTFWQGRVPPPAPSAPAPADPASSVLDELGPAGITVRGRDIGEQLAAAYRRFTEEI